VNLLLDTAFFAIGLMAGFACGLIVLAAAVKSPQLPGPIAKFWAKPEPERKVSTQTLPRKSRSWRKQRLELQHEANATQKQRDAFFGRMQ
jgi:hypothetical protein